MCSPRLCVLLHHVGDLLHELPRWDLLLVPRVVRLRQLPRLLQQQPATTITQMRCCCVRMECAKRASDHPKPWCNREHAHTHLISHAYSQAHISRVTQHTHTHIYTHTESFVSQTHTHKRVPCYKCYGSATHAHTHPAHTLMLHRSVLINSTHTHRHTHTHEPVVRSHAAVHHPNALGDHLHLVDALLVVQDRLLFLFRRQDNAVCRFGNKIAIHQCGKCEILHNDGGLQPSNVQSCLFSSLIGHWKPFRKGSDQKGLTGTGRVGDKPAPQFLPQARQCSTIPKFSPGAPSPPQLSCGNLPCDG